MSNFSFCHICFKVPLAADASKGACLYVGDGHTLIDMKLIEFLSVSECFSKLAGNRTTEHLRSKKLKLRKTCYFRSVA